MANFCSERDAKVSVFDHGLLYGDGVFEGIRAYNGRVFKLKEHIDRLFFSAKAILLEIPMSPAELMQATVETIRANKLRDAYVRLVVTRGVGTLGLNPRSCKNPSVIIIAGKIQVYPAELYARGMDIVTVPTVRNLHSAVNPAIKSLNYLNNILAKIEANNAGVEEAVMLNAEGFVAECTADNLFIVKNGALVDAAALGGRALRHHARPQSWNWRSKPGMKVLRAEPDPLRFVQCGRVFPYRYRRGNHAGDQD